MVPDQWLIALAGQLASIVDQQIPGVIVECGAWRGGTGLFMARVLRDLRDERPVYLYDSFEGLPPPAPIDGGAALHWATTLDGSSYHNNCTASFDELTAVIAHARLTGYVFPVKGWFEATLPQVHHESIALLRIDADWYESVRTCLTCLYDRVAPGGYVVIDDYDTWDGCAVAVHEFLGQRRLSHRLQRAGCAFFRKT